MFKPLIATAAAILLFAVGGTATAGTGPTAQGSRADGLRWQAMADYYGGLQGIKADGLRWQAMARFYRHPAPVATTSSSFHWGDAGIGAAGSVLLLACGGAAIVFVRRSRRTKLAL
jgi:hypothetical protein